MLLLVGLCVPSTVVLEPVGGHLPMGIPGGEHGAILTWCPLHTVHTGILREGLEALPACTSVLGVTPYLDLLIIATSRQDAKIGIDWMRP